MQWTDSQARQCLSYNVMKVNVVESANSCAYFANANRNANCTSSIGSGVPRRRRRCLLQPKSIVVSRCTVVRHCPAGGGSIVQRGLQEAEIALQGEEGGERVLGLSVCLLDNCSQFTGALHRCTHGLEKFAVGTLTSVGSPSGVEWRLVPLYCCVA